MPIFLAALALIALGVVWWLDHRERKYPFAERAEIIAKALREEADLNIVYWSKKRRKFVHKVVTPKALKGQVLEAFDRQRETNRTFKVTRIKKITLISDPLQAKAPKLSAVLILRWVALGLGLASAVSFFLLNRKMHTSPATGTNELVSVEPPANWPTQESTTAPTELIAAVDIAASEARTSTPDILSLELSQLVAGPGSRSETDTASEISESSVDWREPTTSSGFLERAQTRANDRDYAGAIADYSRSIELNPYSPQAWLGRALARLSQMEFDKTIQDAQRAIDLNPLLAGAFFIRGVAQVRRGNLQRAVDDFGQAIQIEPRNATYYNGRAFAYYKKGNWNLAVTDASKAISIDRSNVQAYDTRAWVQFASGNATGAVADCRQAIELNPDSVGGKSSQGLLHFIQGDYAAAVASWRSAIEKSPDYETELGPWIKKADAAVAK
jgi:Flp pilus assembly protein TadD/cbb3-type cytochrome oxidase subunit 3